MTVQAVIFDWGGTLTPWHNVSPAELWLTACQPHFPAAEAAASAAALCAAEDVLWQSCDSDHRGATMADLFGLAQLAATDGLLASYLAAWEPHTVTDPDVLGLFGQLRDRDIRIGVLSNTLWPRHWHENVFRRDGVLGLIDGAVYSSEIGWSKPHPAAFTAAMRAVGVTDPAGCVFVGDRPYQDVHGAQQAGMRAVLIPNGDVPGFSATPDAVISRIADLGPLLADW
ncbi:MAG TPA: HAD family hydrolase [Streptosporangiaceae bacterium]